MSQTNSDLVREACESFNHGDTSAVLERFAVDIEWREPDWLIERGGNFPGRDEVLPNVFETVPRNWDSFRLVPSDFIEAGDLVIAPQPTRAAARAPRRRHETRLPKLQTGNDQESNAASTSTPPSTGDQ